MLYFARDVRALACVFFTLAAATIVGPSTLYAAPSPSAQRAAALTVALSHAAGASEVSDTDVAMAQERQSLLESMAADDAGTVLALAMPSRVRATLPAGLRGFVEQVVTVDGTLEAAIEDAPSSARIHYAIHTAQGRYTLHFAERGPELRTGARVRVTGVQVGEALVSSGTSSVTVQTAALTGTTGVHRTLVLLVNFSDKHDQPYTVETARQVVFSSASNFDLENSYGQTSLSGDVFGWFTIPMSSTVCNQDQIATLAKSAASAAGISLSGYNHFVYGFPQNACTWWGYGMIGGNPTNAWINGPFQLRVVGHEMGHNLGLYHAHSLDCGTQVIGGTCTTSEYGDVVDIMGGSNAGHFSAFQKERLGWIGAGLQPPVHTVTASGTYWLDPLETPGGTSKALKIYQSGATGSRTFYYVELRRPVGADAWLTGNTNMATGVLVHTGSESSGNTDNELDMTPETTSFADAALTVGRAFTDPGKVVTIKPLTVSSTGATVEVDFTSVPCVATVPTVSVTPVTAVWGLPGSAMRYSVTVKNNDAAACAAATYALSATVPAGWTWKGSALSVAPGGTAAATVVATSPLSALEGLYGLRMAAANTANTTKSASAAASAMVVKSLAVRVSLDKTSTPANQTVTATAVVTGGGAAVVGAPATAVVTLPGGSTRTVTGTTGTGGVVKFATKVARKDPKGVWTIRVTATAGGATGSGSAAFTVI